MVVEEAQAGRVMAERDRRIRDFAERVNQIAGDNERKIGGRKVFIADVWDAMDFPHRSDFNRDMLEAHRKGLLELQRADMPQFFDAEDIEASLIEGPLGAYHFVIVQPKRNPQPLDEAREMFLRFHRIDPKEVIVEDDQHMPTHAARMGKSIHVLYRSSKLDPETGKRPPGGVQNYIHEHDAGVHLYDPNDNGISDGASGDLEEVPECDPDMALVLLGECLGIAWKDDVLDEDYEMEWDNPAIELYTTTSGKMLVVVENKREILYLVWGGALGVEPRGIVG
jgi:hypothetical protein